MATSFIRSFIQGHAPAADVAVATPAANGETSQATVPLIVVATPSDAAVTTPASEVQTSQATECSVPASGQSGNVNKCRRKRKVRPLFDNDTIVPSIAVATPSVDTPDAAVATRSSNVETTQATGI
ncbi:hypothetical protein FN846DRAFT_889988 [Sphaerosporella brunnea]|uniref:Uncharacterized protein n=1 Tax=Sphaerosporella brunnea TaxID=1250544 RepID=A0A5J5EXK2_9PEZI|nr:hypothetical protein FN846DRAFT_889988 [Sphaerosporella brunnea]